MKRRSEDALQWGDPRCAAMTVGLYSRKSTASEGKSRSRDEQLALGRMDAERFGFGRVVELTEEEGQKGEWYWEDSEGRFPGPYRPQLTELVRMIERGEVQAIIVYKLNRLVRDNGVEDALVKLCLRFGVHLIVGGRDVELNTARGRCNNATEAARAREWRDQISEDVRRDHDYKFSKCLFTRNPSCHGIRSMGKDSQAIRFVDCELEIVRRIFRMFVGSGGEMPLGTHQIAARLMKEGINLAVGALGHKQKLAGRIHSSQIVSILRNCVYVGEWQHNKQRKSYPQLLIRCEGGDPQPIISRELWDQAQARLAARQRRGNRAATGSRLLTGLAICGSCGQPLHANIHTRRDGSKTERWFCSRRNATASKACFGSSYVSLSVEELDRWTREFLAPMLALDIEEVRAERTSCKAKAEYEVAQNRLQRLKGLEGEKLANALMDLDENGFRALAAELRTKREQLELEVMRLRPVFASDDALVGEGPPLDLLSTETDVLRTALHRFLRYVAVTDKGVIAYAHTGNYIAAGYTEKDLSKSGTRGNRRSVLPPTLEAVAECHQWIGDKEAFARGRRYVLGAAGEHATPSMLVPDWLPDA